MNPLPNNSHVTGIIPARWASSRFPGKPLFPLLGKPLIQHVYERACECQKLDRILIATDHEEIFAVAESLGAQVVMTASDHPTGTDRIAEAAALVPEASHLINIQGDEPLIDPSLIDQLASTLASDSSIDLITAASPITEQEQLNDPNIVKVVLNAASNALYFSRAPIPYPRSQSGGPTPLRHIGLYGYRADFLEKFVKWPPAPMEIAESLEQLRALHHGARIQVILTEHDAIGLDTPEQVSLLESLLEQHQHHRTS